MDIEKIITARHKFDKAFGLLDTPYNHELQCNMLNEEITGKNELLDSLKKLDRIGIADGLADVMVVCLGILNAKGDLQKAPTLNGLLKIKSAEISTLYLLELLSAFKNRLYTPHTIYSIIFEIKSIANFFNIDLEKAYHEVMRSNMSKLDNLEDQ